MIQRGSSQQTDAPPKTPIVLIVDDDPEVRQALSSLFRSVGLEPRLFASTAEFLQHKLPEAPCCIVLDIRLPGVGGLDFQAQLTKANIHIPIVMITEAYPFDSGRSIGSGSWRTTALWGAPRLMMSR